jgi:hypothetical protein
MGERLAGSLRLDHGLACCAGAIRRQDICRGRYAAFPPRSGGRRAKIWEVLMLKFTISEEYELSCFSTALQNLIALDGVWTKNLPTKDKEDVPKTALAYHERQALINIGNDIIGLWDLIQEKVDSVVSILARMPVDSEQIIERLVKDYVIDEVEVKGFHQYSKHHGGYITAAKKTLIEIGQHSKVESREIKRKLDIFGTGEVPVGDMSHGAECGVLFVFAILMVCTAVGPLAAVGVGGFVGRGCVNQ